jgi:hypothetical protein
MKIYNIITKSLDRFRTRSLTHPIAFYWDGDSMKIYQNGSSFVMKELFSGCFMPSSPVKGLILPEEINNLVETQQYIDDNISDLVISPSKWGYNIYKLNQGGNPFLVRELKFYSVKGSIPLFFARLWSKDIKIALKNI